MNENGVPSRTLTSNLEFRTLPLCALSYGDKENCLLETWLSVFPRPASPTALAAENSRVLLLMQPLEEFLETRVGQDGFHRIERVPKLIVTPSLVDKILATVARGCDLASSLAARHYVVSACGHVSDAEDAQLSHTQFRLLIFCPKANEIWWPVPVTLQRPQFVGLPLSF